jgi:hypothetical protein
VPTPPRAPSPAAPATYASDHDDYGGEASDGNDAVSRQFSEATPDSHVGDEKMASWPEERDYAYDERVGMMTADGGLPLAEAQRRAAEYVRRHLSGEGASTDGACA